MGDIFFLLDHLHGWDRFRQSFRYLSTLLQISDVYFIFNILSIAETNLVTSLRLKQLIKHIYQRYTHEDPLSCVQITICYNMSWLLQKSGIIGTEEACGVKLCFKSVGVICIPRVILAIPMCGLKLSVTQHRFDSHTIDLIYCSHS